MSGRFILMAGVKGLIPSKHVLSAERRLSRALCSFIHSAALPN
jgi:hypothetical protein